jgi:ABC-type polysaccharide/polyol phosphate export permease
MRSRSPLAAAIRDLQEGFLLSPLWWRMGLEQTYNRYRRTLLGPFWIAVATMSTGLSIAFVFGSLLGGNWQEFLPRILGGITAWMLVSGVVAEGAVLFVGAAGMMQVQRLPLSFHALLSTNRTVINFLHQLIAFWALMLILRLFVLPHWSILLAIPLVTITGFLLSIPVAMLSTRYRDIGFLVGTVFTVLFLLTPVFWSRAQLPEDRRWVADVNPFGHLLEIIRQPLVGQMAPWMNWQWSLLTFLVSLVLAVVSLMLFRKRVVFWL